ncbi:uncharacterized protein Tco025E_06928 [Trypanosoma conorhini]|uniref:Uncharacterized protein n=1 Tax=Trypanosoma conorhini TaxID=83891 RepID=A0A3R7KLG0_9TRYP|nr:uncharacterized protein Tco025E_06928 [Trypanosoma conorhini]RNF09821.1 hypothetical protein Tco025E_06928 [Trypanosoma conorhini]
MASNDINAFKQHLWSLFQSYSYISGGGGKGDPPARQLSESGYRAVMSLLADIEVINRFFTAEDEITQRESLTRMGSERFRDELWEEMLSAGERLLASASGGTKVIAQEEREEAEADLALTADYDYHVMRPSFGHKTITWDVFHAVLLLRLSNSLHLRAGEYVLQECREALHPSAWLLPARGSCELPRCADSAPDTSPNGQESCSDKAGPAKTAMRLTFASAKGSAPQCSPTSVNSLTCSVSKTSADDKAPVGAVDVHADQVPQTSLSFLGLHRLRDKETCEQPGAAVPPSPPAGTNMPFCFVDSIGGRTDVTKGILAGAGPHQSSPPPRPKPSSMAVPIFSCPARAGSAKWGQVTVEIKRLRQRLARGDEGHPEKNGADALLTDSRKSAVSPSLETTLDMWNTAHVSKSILPLDAASEASPARCDEEASQRYKERCRQASRCLGPAPAASLSPSPSPEPTIGAKAIIASPNAGMQDDPHPPLGERACASEKKLPAADNAHDGNLRRCVQVSHANEPIACGRSTDLREAPRPRLVALLPPESGMRKQRMPPPSPSRRALSRVASGRRPVQPIVPRTRAPLKG